MGEEAADAASIIGLPDRFPGKGGFTLLEVVAVLVLLGILAAVAVARFADSNADAVAEAEIFKSHLRYAQIRAMGDIYPWTIEVGSGSYALSTTNPSIGTPTLPGESGATHSYDGGVTASTTGTSPFSFNWRGCLVNAASPNVCLSTPGRVTFDGDPDIEVTVQAETGFAQ